MGRTCTVCGHKDVEEINKQLLSGPSLRTIAAQFNLTKTSLIRHRESHIPDLLLKSNDIQEIVKADVLLVQLGEIREKTLSLLDKAEQAADTRVYGAPVAYLREVREQIKLLAELEGRLAAQPQITIVNNPEWVELRTLIITALEPYPDAKAAVVDAIRRRG